MDPAQATDAAPHGFRYFYELVVGSIIAAFLALQGWVVTMLISHGRKIERIDASRVTREDFDRWREEQALALDEVRASTIASNKACAEAVERSQEKLETTVSRALDKVDASNRELLVALAKRGLES